MSVPTICSVGYIPTAPVRAAVLHPSGKYLLSTCLNILSVHPLFSADAFHLSICSSSIHCIVTLSDTPHIVTVHDTCIILWHLALKKPLSVVGIEAATGHPPQRDAVAIAESSSSDRYSIAVVSNGLGCLTVSVYSCSLVSGFVAKPYDELVIPDFSSIVSICAFPFSRTLLCCSAKEIIFVGVRSLVSFKPAAGTTLELLSRISNSVLLNSSDEFVAACAINSEGLVAVLTKCVRVVFFDTSASIIRVISVSSAENLHPRFSSMAACSQYLYIGTLCGRVHICRTDCNYACASIIENPFASQNGGLLAASASVCRILPRIFPSSLMLVTYGNGISVFLDTAHDFLLKMRMLSATGRKMVLFHNSPFPLSALYESFRLFDPSTMTLFECKYGTSTDMKLLCHSMFPTDASITAFCQQSPTDRWHSNHIVSYWGDDMGRVHLLKLKPTASACQEIQHRQCIIVPNIEHRHGVSDLILCPQERYLVVVWKSGRACIYDTQSAFAPCCSFNVCVSSSQDSVHFRSVWFLSANRLIVRSSSTGIIVYRLIPVLSPALPAYRVGAVDTGSYASAELGFRVLTEGAFDCVMDAFSTRWSEEAGLTDGILVSGLVCHPFLPYVWLSLTSGLCVLLDVGSDTCVRGYFPIAIGARLVTIDHSGLYLAFADSHAAHEGGRIIFYQSLTGSFLPFATISNSAGFMANMSVSADGKALCGVGSFGEIVTWRMHASVPQTIANLYLTVGRDASAGESVKDQLRRWWLLHPISYQKSGESETIHTEQSFALSVDHALDRSCSATRGSRPSRSATLPADLLPYPVMDSLDSSSVASVSRPRFLSDSFSSTVSAAVGSPSPSLPPRMAGTPATPVGRRDASTDCGLLQRFEGNTTVSHEENLQVTSKPVLPSPLFGTMSPAEEEVCEDIVNSFLSNCVFVDKQPRLPSNVDDAMNSEHAMASEPVPSLATVSGDDSGTSIEGTGAIVASASAVCMEIIDDIVATVGDAIEVPFVGTTGEDSPNAIPSVLTAGPVAPELGGKSSALLSSPRDEALSVDAKEQENLQNSEEDENQGAVCLSEHVETTGTETVSQEHSETIPDADMQQ